MENRWVVVRSYEGVGWVWLDPCDDVNILCLDGIPINILAVIVYYGFARCCQWGKLSKGYMGSLCIIFYNCTWNYSYHQIRSLMFFKSLYLLEGHMKYLQMKQEKWDQLQKSQEGDKSARGGMDRATLALNWFSVKAGHWVHGALYTIFPIFSCFCTFEVFHN